MSPREEGGDFCKECGAPCFTPFCEQCGFLNKPQVVDNVPAVVPEVVPEVPEVPELSYPLCVVVVGRTGQGKSTLCNVLMNLLSEDDVAFPIGHQASSCTEEASVKECEHEDGFSLQVVDTVGWGNTQMAESDVLLSFVFGAKLWLPQVLQFLYVCSEKVSADELVAFK
jgi:hypothetical protein